MFVDMVWRFCGVLKDFYFSEDKIVRNEWAVFANCLLNFCDFQVFNGILLKITVHLTYVRVLNCTRSYSCSRIYRYVSNLCRVQGFICTRIYGIIVLGVVGLSSHVHLLDCLRYEVVGSL
jgi:hypothetical protein